MQHAQHARTLAIGRGKLGGKRNPARGRGGHGGATCHRPRPYRRAALRHSGRPAALEAAMAAGPGRRLGRRDAHAWRELATHAQTGPGCGASRWLATCLCLVARLYRYPPVALTVALVSEGRPVSQAAGLAYGLQQAGIHGAGGRSPGGGPNQVCKVCMRGKGGAWVPLDCQCQRPCSFALQG